MVNDGGRFIGGLFTVSGWMRIPTNFFRGWDLSSLKPEWFNLIVISSMGNELTMITLLAKHQPSRLILNTIGLPPTQWQSQPGFLHFYHPRKVTAWITWTLSVWGHSWVCLFRARLSLWFLQFVTSKHYLVQIKATSNRKTCPCTPWDFREMFCLFFPCFPLLGMM